MAEARSLPSGIVALAGRDDPGVEARLGRHAGHAGGRGIRHIVNWHSDPARSYAPADATNSDAWARGFALLRKYGLSFDLQAYAGQFAHLAALLARHPDTPEILNHSGMQIPDDPDGWGL